MTKKMKNTSIGMNKREIKRQMKKKFGFDFQELGFDLKDPSKMVDQALYLIEEINKEYKQDEVIQLNMKDFKNVIDQIKVDLKNEKMSKVEKNIPPKMKINIK